MISLTKKEYLKLLKSEGASDGGSILSDYSDKEMEIYSTEPTNKVFASGLIVEYNGVPLEFVISLTFREDQYNDPRLAPAIKAICKDLVDNYKNVLSRQFLSGMVRVMVNGFVPKLRDVYTLVKVKDFKKKK